MSSDPCLQAGRSANSTSRKEFANACGDPISPYQGVSGVASLRCAPQEPREEEQHEVMGVDDQEEEVEEGRVPKTRKFPDSMSLEELRAHSLTYIPGGKGYV